VSEHYQRPGWVTTNVFNRLVRGLTRAGVSVRGSRVLEVPGRRSGEPRRNPVNLLTLEGKSYLVAARGNTQWVRNLRASGEGRLILGRRAERFAATELDDDEKPRVLRPYLRRWRFEVGVFFKGVGPDSSDEELRRIAPDHPVFRIGPPLSAAAAPRSDPPTPGDAPPSEPPAR
jgi:deazaflavin-dependent oxidoreductase (nitroreductase family)